MSSQARDQWRREQWEAAGPPQRWSVRLFLSSNLLWGAAEAAPSPFPGWAAAYHRPAGGRPPNLGWWRTAGRATQNRPSSDGRFAKGWRWPIFRRGLPPQYRQRCGVSLPCSGWERVVPPRSNHQHRGDHITSRGRRQPQERGGCAAGRHAGVRAAGRAPMPCTHRQCAARAGCRRHAGVVRNGGAEGARTPDLRRARAALSQLSYGPKWDRLSLPSQAATRNTRMGPCVQMEKTELKGLPVLDTRRLSRSQLNALAALFDDAAEGSFERLPGMVECPTRTAVGDGTSEILGLPSLDGLRRLLASEPPVSNRRL